MNLTKEGTTIHIRGATFSEYSTIHAYYKPQEKYIDSFPTNANEHICRAFKADGMTCTCYPNEVEDLCVMYIHLANFKYLHMLVQLEDIRKLFAFKLTLIDLIKNSQSIEFLDEDNEIYEVMHLDSIDQALELYYHYKAGGNIHVHI